MNDIYVSRNIKLCKSITYIVYVLQHVCSNINIFHNEDWRSKTILTAVSLYNWVRQQLKIHNKNLHVLITQWQKFKYVVKWDNCFIWDYVADWRFAKLFRQRCLSWEYIKLKLEHWKNSEILEHKPKFPTFLITFECKRFLKYLW